MVARRFPSASGAMVAVALAGCGAQRGPAAAPPHAQMTVPEAVAVAAKEGPKDDDCTKPAEDDDDGEHGTLDDGFEAPAAIPAHAGASTPLPFADLGDDAIAARLRTDLGALGPMSIGRPHGGLLVDHRHAFLVLERGRYRFFEVHGHAPSSPLRSFSVKYASGLVR